jgi:hypothetical protein
MKIKLGEVLGVARVQVPSGEDLYVMCRCGHRAGLHEWKGTFKLEDNSCKTNDGCEEFFSIDTKHEGGRLT